MYSEAANHIQKNGATFETIRFAPAWQNLEENGRTAARFSIWNFITPAFDQSATVGDRRYSS
jgi:hypothetical protein